VLGFGVDVTGFGQQPQHPQHAEETHHRRVVLVGDGLQVNASWMEDGREGERRERGGYMERKGFRSRDWR
jgi:hypothetical protein